MEALEYHKDDERLKLYCYKGMKHEEMASELGRSTASILARMRAKGLRTSLLNQKRGHEVKWEIFDLIPFQKSSSRRGFSGFSEKSKIFLGALRG